jgi:superfamily I DNA/RNA helicase
MIMNEDATGALESIGRCDHSATNEYRLFGPPGTGKTSGLADHVKRAAKEYGSDKLLVTSFSRTAAAELADRYLPINHDRIGTLHSFCWHTLGGPKIAEGHVAAWNRRNPGTTLTPANRQGRLDGEQPGEDDDTRRAGDLMLQGLNRCRGQMLGPESWPPRVRDFAAKWEEYKRAEEILDFCDLID